MNCNCPHDCNLLPDMDPLKADIYTQFNSDFIEKEFKKLTEQAVSDIIDNLGITNNTADLNLPETDKVNKYVKSIKQDKGQISVETADIDSNYTKIDSDTVASTQSIDSAIKALNSKATVPAGSYITEVSEINGIVTVNSIPFDDSIKDSLNAPTNKAVFDSLTAMSNQFKQDLNNAISDLEFSADLTDKQLIGIEINSGKVTASTKPLATSITQTSDIPTSMAVYNAIKDKFEQLENVLSNRIDNLNYTDSESPLTFVTAVSQQNGQIAVTKKPLPPIGTGNVSITINGVENKFGLNQDADTAISFDIPTSTSQLVNDSKFITNADIENKVDKESGKQLSTNDYSDAEKQKLSEIEDKAQVNKIETVTITGGTSTYGDKSVNLELTDYYNKADMIKAIGVTEASLETKILDVDNKVDSLEAELKKGNINTISVAGGKVDYINNTVSIELTDYYNKADTDKIVSDSNSQLNTKISDIETKINSLEKNGIETITVTGGNVVYNNKDAKIELTDYYNKADMIKAIGVTEAQLETKILDVDNKVDTLEAELKKGNINTISIIGGNVNYVNNSVEIELTDYYNKADTIKAIDDSKNQIDSDISDINNKINDIEKNSITSVSVIGGNVNYVNNSVEIELTDYYNKADTARAIETSESQLDTKISDIDAKVDKLESEIKKNGINTVSIVGGKVEYADNNAAIELTDYYNKVDTDKIVADSENRLDSKISDIEVKINDLEKDSINSIAITGGKVDYNDRNVSIELTDYYTKADTTKAIGDAEARIDSKISNITTKVEDLKTEISKDIVGTLSVTGGKVNYNGNNATIELLDYYNKKEVDDLIVSEAASRKASIDGLTTAIAVVEKEVQKPIVIEGGTVTYKDGKVEIELDDYYNKSEITGIVSAASDIHTNDIKDIITRVDSLESKQPRTVSVKGANVIQNDSQVEVELTDFYNKTEVVDLVKSVTDKHENDISHLNTLVADIEADLYKPITIKGGKVTYNSDNINLELMDYYDKVEIISLLGAITENHNKDVATINGVLSTIEVGSQVNRLEAVNVVGGEVTQVGKTATIQLTDYYTKNEADIATLDKLSDIKSKLNTIEYNAQKNTIDDIVIDGGSVIYNGTTASLSLTNFFTKAETINAAQTIFDNSMPDTSGIMNKLNTIEPNAQENIIESVILHDNGKLTSLPITDKSVTIDLTNKVDAEPFMGLSKNNFSDELLTKLNSIEVGAEQNKPVDWDETDVNNAAFIKNKPVIGDGQLTISINDVKTTFSANQTDNTEVSVKIPVVISDLIDDKGLALESEVSQKVDKVPGKSLISDDLIIKLSGLAETSEEKTVRINVDGKRLTTDANGAYNIDLTGKVDKELDKSLISNTLIDKLSNIEENANNYILPIASVSVVGGVKIGNNLSVTSDGTLSISSSNVQNALGFKPVGLDESGKINASLLPGFVDDVIEGKYINKTTFEVDGKTYIPEAGKLYIDTDKNITYRWSGTQFTEISNSVNLGETSSSAFRGDYGKIAYEHVSDTDNPHNVTKAQLGLDKVVNETIENQTPIFVEADSLNNIASAEKLGSILGKVKKAISSLISHISDSSKHLSTELLNKINNSQEALSKDQLDAVNSGVTSDKLTDITDHIDNNSIHISSSDRTNWDNKQNALTANQLSAINSGITSDIVNSIEALSKSVVTDEEKAKWNSAEPNKIEKIYFNNVEQPILDKSVHVELDGSSSVDISNNIVTVKVDAATNNLLSSKDSGLYVKNPVSAVYLNDKVQEYSKDIINIKFSGSSTIDVTDNNLSVKTSETAGNILSKKDDGLYVSNIIKSYAITETLNSYMPSKSIEVGNIKTFLSGNTHISGFMYKLVDESYVLIETISGIITVNGNDYAATSIAGACYIQGDKVYMTFNNSINSTCKYVISYTGVQLD